MAYDRIEGFGDQLIAVMLAQLTAVVANLFLKEGATPIKPVDFLPGARQERQEQSPQQMAAALDMWVGATAGKKGSPQAR